MSSLKEQKEEMVNRLKEINEKLTDEMIDNATKEEMERYIELVDEIIARLETIDDVLTKNIN